MRASPHRIWFAFPPFFRPTVRWLTRKEGLKYLSPGEVVFAVIGRELHARAAPPPGPSSIGVAIPADHNTYGYLSEHHSFGETEDGRRGVRRKNLRRKC